MRLQIDVKGMEKTQKNMRKRELQLARRTLSRGLRAGGKITLEATRNSAPVRSGLLKKSLKLRVAKAKKPYVRFRVTNASQAYWGLFIEKGTKRIQARHFMQRAAERTRRDVIARVKQQLKEDLRA